MRIKINFSKNKYIYVKDIIRVEDDSFLNNIDDFYFDKDEVIANVFVSKKSVKLKPSPSFREWYYRASKGRKLTSLQVKNCYVDVPFVFGTKKVPTVNRVIILDFDEEE